ncbi:prolipoprotein diacylglyceryl transferase [Methylobacillus flagellatus]|uniref:Phosphatidylglycerol--prolipoprotein diacylglyceryl transferase n=1 Tax=Methylobacillus flagellatus (strain ATCC 51484 / DSM 6875 / VKM B-1610 / KT) TaxID=265072 RepID=LGT_METFK|nr:prolipoprotein diacylglyceryl transferase [Methylobacillus flagellatus]Q1H4H7.1 RecName: Full=Phosphatidylglycerol--prolipoprotein diacylglyceryl transferase [Methylobacillus flagellatus KT]ABE48610.1 prolipoprotein diacylglyceryl transferase [Methylobacillus flagellatus KT]
MLVHPQFDPVAIHLGSFGIHWYGLMYLIGFLAFLWLGRWRIAHQPWWGKAGWTKKNLDDALFYGALGVILGGRLGYALFYQHEYYLTHPHEILFLWQGGMSFHGGFLGVMVAMLLFAKRRGLTFFGIMDFVAPLVPVGLGAGRMGNFINGELWGRASDLPWAMVFPHVDSIARHPSQLYEFLLEGVALFILLWWYSSKPRARGSVSALFLIGYGSFRFLVEFTREPDSFLGLLSLGLSMGQWLSLPMVIAGVWLLIVSLRR